MEDEKYVAENLEHQYRTNKILSNLKDRILQLEQENEKLKERLKKYEDKCECGGELMLDKELNSDPKMLVYNCNECHKNVTRVKNE